MNPLKDLLTGGFSGVIDSISGVIGKFVADPNAKVAAQLEVTRIAKDYQVEVLQTERDVAVQQASIVVAETKSDSWLAKNWRPITMLTFVFIIVWNFIIIGTIGAFVASIHPVEIPPDMWNLLTRGLEGYVYARTIEKTAPGLIAAIKK